MSAIYFHSPAETVSVRGPERAYAGGVCRDLFALALGLNEHFVRADDVARFRRLFPNGHYTHGITGEPAQVMRSIQTAVAVGEEFFTASLNTAIRMGSDAVVLLARLHGQCEIHTYVEGKHRAWLAEIIERGRADGVLRSEMGWEGVVTMLRYASDTPVVTSYSVCDGFPNAGVAKWEGDDDGDGFYELPHEEQWTLALKGIRGERGLRMEPRHWRDFHFGNGESAFTLREAMHAAEVSTVPSRWPYAGAQEPPRAAIQPTLSDDDSDPNGYGGDPS